MSYYNLDQFDYEPCIYRDYAYKYENLVQEMAIEIIKRENANNGPDEQWLESEWYDFKDEAVALLCKKHNVMTYCSGCSDKLDLWDNYHRKDD